MSFSSLRSTTTLRTAVNRTSSLPLVAGLLGVGMLGITACASSGATSGATPADAAAPGTQGAEAAVPAPRPTPTSDMTLERDPRIGLRPGVFDAEEAIWNLHMVSTTPPPQAFVGVTNSDLAFKGDYAIQGNYNGIQVWDISDPSEPSLVIGYVCPASQSDVSVYENLLFVSGEGLGGRLDCGTEGVEEAVSAARLRGIRIFDITDIRNPKYLANVQTCRCRPAGAPTRTRC
jgi:hypothetical protein